MTTSTVPRNTAIDLPDGLNVHGLVSLLDVEKMSNRIRQCLPSGAVPLATCRITNLRFKTRSSVTISYELSSPSDEGGGEATIPVYIRAFSTSEYADARRRSELSRWVPTSTGLTINHLDDLDAILYWFPNDERLDGLRHVVEARKLQRIFYRELKDYPASDWRISDHSIRLTLLRYKPERRAVFRCRFRAHRHDGITKQERFVFLGVYEQERFKMLWPLLNQAYGASRRAHLWLAPSPLGRSDEDGLIIIDELRGHSLRGVLAVGPSDSLERVAQAIAELHQSAELGCSLAPVDPGDSLTSAERLLGTLVSDARATVTSIATQLRTCMSMMSPPTNGFVHGDLHPGQLMLDDDRVGVVDFDRSHRGDPLEDVGNFRAQLWLGTPGGKQWDDQLCWQRFHDAYLRASALPIDESRIRMWTAYALFQSALTPLGRFEPDWRKRTHEILDRTLAVMS